MRAFCSKVHVTRATVTALLAVAVIASAAIVFLVSQQWAYMTKLEAALFVVTGGLSVTLMAKAWYLSRQQELAFLRAMQFAFADVEVIQAKRATLRDLQRECARTSVVHARVTDRLSIAALGLAGEAGEVADHVKKWRGHGHRLNVEAVVKELFDVLWYVSEIATALHVPLDLVFSEGSKKLRKRYPTEFSAAQSIHRKDEAFDLRDDSDTVRLMLMAGWKLERTTWVFVDGKTQIRVTPTHSDWVTEDPQKREFWTVETILPDGSFHRSSTRFTHLDAISEVRSSCDLWAADLREVSAKTGAERTQEL